MKIQPNHIQFWDEAGAKLDNKNYPKTKLISIESQPKTIVVVVVVIIVVVVVVIPVVDPREIPLEFG